MAVTGSKVVLIGMVLLNLDFSLVQGDNTTRLRTKAAVVRDCSGLRARGLRVAITGASSGIGLAGARMLYECGAHVTLLNRNAASVQAGVDAIRGSGEAREAGVGTVEGLVCDLSSLRSVGAAADVLTSAREPIDVLALNAGVHYGELEPRITEDGFEQTLATNHLGHVLLAERLLPTLARARRQRRASGVDAPSRIVVTSSQMHDPTSPGGSRGGEGATLGTLAGLEGQGSGSGMVDGGEFNGNKMYKDTKLANVLFTYELTRRLAAAGVSSTDIAVNTFCPGLITESGFFRNTHPLFAWTFDFFARRIFHLTESVKGGGTLLANMAANPDYYGGSGGYWNNARAGFGRLEFVPAPSSAESQDAAKAAKFYDASARLVGVDADAAVSSAAAALQ